MTMVAVNRRTFYTGSMAEPYALLSRFYDEDWGDFSLNYAEMLDRLLRERGIKRARIIDLGCGTGVLASALASLGHTVTGIDRSPSMIDVARSRTKGQPRVSFVIGDMTELAGASDGYDAAVCSFDAVNYLRRLPLLKKFFKHVATMLLPAGLFLFDSNTETLYKSQNGNLTPHRFGDITILEESRYDPRSRTATTLFSFPDGTCEVHYQRPWEDKELMPRLEAAGFDVLYRYSWFDSLPFYSKAPKIFYVAEKRN